MSTKQIPNLVARLYTIVNELETLFPGRKFTPDGHLVGSLGEVIAAYEYGLVLLPGSAKGHDARDCFGRRVQIKATQRTSVALRSAPDFLLVLKIHSDGSTTEIFNGPGAAAWASAGMMQSNGQRGISLSKLGRLAKSVASGDRISRNAANEDYLRPRAHRSVNAL